MIILVLIKIKITIIMDIIILIITITKPKIGIIILEKIIKEEENIIEIINIIINKLMSIN